MSFRLEPNPKTAEQIRRNWQILSKAIEEKALGVLPPFAQSDVSGLVDALGGKISDAASDGNLYGRKNGDWSAIPSGGGGGGGGGEAPTGAVAYYPAATPPDGWLLCDGSTITAADYPDLAALLPHPTATGTNELPTLSGPDSRVIVSSSYDGNQVGWKCFNGSVSDNWASGDHQEIDSYVGWNYGSARYVTKVIYTVRTYSGAHPPATFTLQGSTDLSTWTDIESFTLTASWAPNTAYEFPVTLSEYTASYTAYRILITTVYGSGWVDCGELGFLTATSISEDDSLHLLPSVLAPSGLWAIIRT